MSEERAVLPKEVQPGYLVTGKAPKHTHTHTHTHTLHCVVNIRLCCYSSTDVVCVVIAS